MTLADFKTQFTLVGLDLKADNKTFEVWVAIIAWRGPDTPDEAEPCIFLNAKTGAPFSRNTIEEYWDVLEPTALELHDNLRKNEVRDPRPYGQTPDDDDVTGW